MRYRAPYFDYDKQTKLVKGKFPPGYVDAGGLGLPNGSKGKYGLRDAPGAGDPSGLFEITDCAVCDTGATRTLLGCADFTYDRSANTIGKNAATGGPGQIPSGQGYTKIVL
jgi:hypothetical protein